MPEAASTKKRRPTDPWCFRQISVEWITTRYEASCSATLGVSAHARQALPAKKTQSPQIRKIIKSNGVFFSTARGPSARRIISFPYATTGAQAIIAKPFTSSARRTYVVDGVGATKTTICQQGLTSLSTAELRLAFVTA